MSNWPSGHPDEGLLLRSLDGELPARKARQVRQSPGSLLAVPRGAGIARSHGGRMRPLPQAGAGRFAAGSAERVADRWIAGFDRVDAELAAVPFWKRLPRLAPAWQWGVAAAAAAALLIAAVVQLGRTPSVQAASLLEKAVAAAGAHRAPVRTIAIHLRSGLTTLHTVGGAAGNWLPLPPDIEKDVPGCPL